MSTETDPIAQDAQRIADAMREMSGRELTDDELAVLAEAVGAVHTEGDA
ncbi:hypothetical protein GCM10023196_036090 [Actinoallomurus vinaceus]|uniref:Uncharacterized protein n=1 Tax=Actinoallomurus vinaceus TaxID=1080074 RepID=A0ABP8UAH2_9ACTN